MSSKKCSFKEFLTYYMESLGNGTFENNAGELFRVLIKKGIVIEEVLS